MLSNLPLLNSLRPVVQPIDTQQTSRNNFLPPPRSIVCSNADDGSQLLASVDQALPLLQGWLSFTRLRLRADKPIQLGPLSLHLKVR